MSATEYALAKTLVMVDRLPLPPSESSTSEEFLKFTDLAADVDFRQGAGGFGVAVIDSSSALMVEIVVSVSSPQYPRLRERWIDYRDPDTPSERVAFDCITPNGDQYTDNDGIPAARPIPNYGKNPDDVAFKLILPNPTIKSGVAV